MTYIPTSDDDLADRLRVAVARIGVSDGELFEHRVAVQRLAAILKQSPPNRLPADRYLATARLFLDDVKETPNRWPETFADQLATAIARLERTR